MLLKLHSSSGPGARPAALSAQRAPAVPWALLTLGSIIPLVSPDAVMTAASQRLWYAARCLAANNNNAT